MLKDVTLIKSELSSIFISSDFKELKGVELDVSQALDVVRLLGVKLK